MKQLLFMLLVASFSIGIFGSSAYAAVDLNTATSSELQSVSGIGPKKAEAIVEYRKKNGQFKSVSDLDKVPGFGKSTVDKVKNEITVGNAQETTAKPAKTKAAK